MPSDGQTGVVHRLKSQKPNLDRLVFATGWLFLISYIILPKVGVDVAVRTAILGIFLILVFDDAW